MDGGAVRGDMSCIIEGRESICRAVRRAFRPIRNETGQPPANVSITNLEANYILTLGDVPENSFEFRVFSDRFTFD